MKEKMDYVYRRIEAGMDEPDSFKDWTVKKGFDLISKCWREVAGTTIQNCWRSAGFELKEIPVECEISETESLIQKNVQVCVERLIGSPYEELFQQSLNAEQAESEMMKTSSHEVTVIPDEVEISDESDEEEPISQTDIFGSICILNKALEKANASTNTFQQLRDVEKFFIYQKVKSQKQKNLFDMWKKWKLKES